MIAIQAKQYKVYIADGLLESFDFGQFHASEFVIITDANVKPIIADKLASRLQREGHKLTTFVIPAGEASKSLPQAGIILSQLANANIDREAVLLAVGGGVVGDVTGFVASIYKRGVSYIQVPTTLLSQVDSSIGAKTAVNLPEGKNLAGSNNPPLAVLTDSSLPAGLPVSELHNGLAEITKYGVVWDSELFDSLEQFIGKEDSVSYAPLIERAVRTKISIADQDPHEKEFRKILNYGHTIGHALEAASSNSLPHGQAVAIGMICEGHIASSLDLFSPGDLARQNNLLLRLINKLEIPGSDDELITLMRRDKKSRGGQLYFVIPLAIGKVKQEGGLVAFPVGEQLVRSSLSYTRELLQKSQ